MPKPFTRSRRVVKLVIVGRLVQFRSPLPCVLAEDFSLSLISLGPSMHQRQTGVEEASSLEASSVEVEHSPPRRWTH